jgi:hypothetical protein
MDVAFTLCELIIQHYNKERGDSVIETDAYKAELAQYESPIQEVRDSL